MISAADFVGAAVLTAVLLLAARGRLRRQRAAHRESIRLAAEANERLQLALDGADEALWDWKIQENETHYSERWSGMLGYSPDEIGRSVEIWERLVHPDDRAGAVAKLEAHLAGETESYQAEFRMKAKDGAWRWIQARGRVVARLANGAPARVAGTHIDVTDRRRIADELAAARNAALEASRAKSAFLAHMSHEIRTPMNGIVAISELLYESARGPEQREYADIVRSSGAALLTILNDILDFSRIEAGKLRIEAAPFDLHAAVRQSADLFALAAARKGVALTVEIAPDAPAWVTGDSGRLRQALVNLIGNAVKFTAHGAIRVRCWGSAEFEIADTGPGIAPGALAKLFQPFTQADGSIALRYGGTGLGLAIAKQLVELMGGKIEAESVEGKGSAFRISLPLAEAAPSAAPTREAAPAMRGAPARILLAEDNPINQRVARHLLRGLGHEVEIVSTGREALEAARAGAYDAILLDCQMPEMSGYEAARALRSHFGSGPRPPVLALTASCMASDREACLEAGMDDHIAKPVTLDALAAALARNGVGLSAALAS